MKKPGCSHPGFFIDSPCGVNSRWGMRPLFASTGSRGRERPSAARQGRNDIRISDAFTLHQQR